MGDVEGRFRWVLLRHDVPGGPAREASWHYDWMIEEDGREGLVCFRVMERVDLMVAGMRFQGARLADHRRVYLEYEGEISGGRGRVARVAAGTCGGWREDASGASVVMGAVRMVGRVARGEVWGFEVERV